MCSGCPIVNLGEQSLMEIRDRLWVHDRWLAEGRWGAP